MGHKVILSALSLLKERNLCTNIRGLYEILIGINGDPRAKDLDCYNHYASLSQRSFASKVHTLTRYGLIRNVYREEINDYALFLTEKGEKEIVPIKWHKHPAKQSNILEVTK